MLHLSGFKINTEDLDLLTNRELYYVGKHFKITYKGRINIINDIGSKLKTLSEDTVLPRQLRNIVIAKRIRNQLTDIYDITALIPLPDANVNNIKMEWDFKSETLDEARCDIIKILTFARRVPDADIIIVMHPNFDILCPKLVGVNFETELHAMVKELEIKPYDMNGKSKDVKVLMLEILNRLPITEPTDIDWKILLNYMLTRPELIAESYTYFGKLGLLNQIYLMKQLSIDGLTVQPAGTMIEWTRQQVTINTGQRPYSIAIPVTSTGRIVYSPSIFLFYQTSWHDKRVRLSGLGLDINKLNIPSFDLESIMKLASSLLDPDYHEYLDTVASLVIWSYDPSVKTPYHTVPDSITALKVISVVSDILRLGKIKITIEYTGR